MDKNLNEMSILCSFDDGYSPYAGAMLTSLFENNKDSHITVYVLTDYIRGENLQKFKKLADTYSQEIIVKYIEKKEFEGLPFGGKFQNISLAAYYRLLADVVVPQDVKNILYLDCDIVINGNLRALFTNGIKKTWQVMTLMDTPYVAKAATERLNLGKDNFYGNAGVMLLNLEELRKMSFSKKAFEFIKFNMDKIVYHDQDVINFVLTKKAILPLKYNVLECVLMKTPIVDKYYVNEIDDAINNPVIIHYSGVRKPWHVECTHPYKYLYERYLALSPWKGTPAIHKYKGWKSKLAFKFKTLVKYLLLFVGNGKYVYKNINRRI